jgi:AraC-like DNA-binding protein
MTVLHSTPASIEPSTSAVTVVDIHDPTAVGENVRALTQDAVQLQATRLQARRITVRLGTCLLIWHSCNQPLRTRTTLQDGFLAFSAIGPAAKGTVNGMTLRRDRVLITPAGIEVEYVIGTGYQSTAFLIPPQELLAHLQFRRRDDIRVDLKAPTFVQTSPASASELYHWGHRVASAAAKHPDAFDDAQTNDLLRLELIETLLAKLESSEIAQVTPHDLTRQTHSRIVRAAEDYAMAQTADRLHISDLCIAADVSERTLQYAFQDIMGMSPLAYLTRLRLHQVRKALRAKSIHSTTVAREALRCGFGHLGDFSRAYERCFGELPSKTLRRNTTNGSTRESV